MSRAWAWSIGDAMVIHPDANVDELVALTEEGPQPPIITPDLGSSFHNLSILSQQPHSLWSGATWSDAGLALLGLLGFAVCSIFVSGWRGGVLPLVGFLLGACFIGADVSFARAFADIFDHRRSTKARQIIWLFALTSLAALPILTHHLASPYVFPVGIASFVGSFMFGVGGGLCRSSASGMLMSFSVGDPNGLVVMLAFCMGSTIGAYHWASIATLPSLPPLYLVSLGWGGVFLHFSMLLLMYLTVALVEYKYWGELEVSLIPYPLLLWRRKADDEEGGRGMLSHRPPPPHSKLCEFGERFGVLGIVFGAMVVLYCQGAPWGVSSAFAQVGARLLDVLSPGTVENWRYFQDPTRKAMLHRSVLQDPTFLVDTGFLLAVTAVATATRRFSLDGWSEYSSKFAIMDIVGGMLLGYGARIAFGCNISGWWGGVESFSLHGWAWGAAAIPGWLIGHKIRAIFLRSDVESNSVKGGGIAGPPVSERIVEGLIWQGSGRLNRNNRSW